MKKIPTLFRRVFENYKLVGITNEVCPGMEWVLEGKGVATVKFDGSCVAIINEEYYKRFDAKKGKSVPEGAIPCCEPDPVTGHHPHWVKVDPNNPADKWYWEAYNTLKEGIYFIPDGTYEAIGRHFNGNPYGYFNDFLIRHGSVTVEVPRSFDGIRQYLEENDIEGIVFWKDGEPQCKIKRTDFGFEWNGKGERK